MTKSVQSQFAAGIHRVNAALSLIFVIIMAPVVTGTPLAGAQIFMFNRADYATGQGPETLAVGDFNGDGKMDVVVGNTNSQSNTVSVLLGKADGTFAPAVDYAVAASPTSVAVGDFNGDGKLDIIAVCEGSFAQVSVLSATATAPSSPSFRPPPAREVTASRSEILMAMGNRCRHLRQPGTDRGRRHHARQRRWNVPGSR